jgi:hypothetical protein
MAHVEARASFGDINEPGHLGYVGLARAMVKHSSGDSVLLGFLGKRLDSLKRTRQRGQDLVMTALVDRPGLLFVVSFAAFLFATFLGVIAQRAWRLMRTGEQNELTIVQSAALTLLGLIVGFSFSMAVSRYDQRKNLEEAEANAIGTEFARADLMPESVASGAHGSLKRYLDQRILFYSTSDPGTLKQIRTDTEKLGADLWALARSNALAQPTPVAALVASGMNDVLNSADYTTAAWLNRTRFRHGGSWS